MLLRFLASEGLPIPLEDDSGIWKHLPRPPRRDEYAIPQEFRAIYLVSDPIDAVLSVFRRGFHMAHAVRMQSEKNWPQSFVLRDDPDAVWGLADYVKLGRDCFGIIEQYEAWTSCSPHDRSYPIAVVKYEAMWDCLGELYDFIGLPRSRLVYFPARKGRNRNRSCTASHIATLNTIYGDLRSTISSLPPFWVY
jgi:hypothetical protein